MERLSFGGDVDNEVIEIKAKSNSAGVKGKEHTSGDDCDNVGR